MDSFSAEVHLYTKQSGPKIEGILLIYHQGEWGTICDDNFDGNDAKVACRQLNLTSDYAQYFSGYNFMDTDVDVPMWIDDLACTGTERSILSCPRTSLYRRTNCQQDVSVRCPGKW